MSVGAAGRLNTTVETTVSMPDDSDEHQEVIEVQILPQVSIGCLLSPPGFQQCHDFWDRTKKERGLLIAGVKLDVGVTLYVTAKDMTGHFFMTTLHVSRVSELSRLHKL